MSQILVVEPDAALAGQLGGRLRSSGHRVKVVTDAEQALEAAARTGFDLVLADLSRSGTPGLEVIRDLRRQTSTQSLPILALSDPNRGPDRLEILHAGADDLITGPLDPEDLMLRVQRLSATGSVEPMALEGRLESQLLWEVMQFIFHTAKRGQLLVWDRSRSGRMQLEQGQAVFAEWDGLLDEEALLAMLGLEEGRFRFVVDGGDSSAAPKGRPLPVRQILIESAWIEDELGKRRRYLPAPNTPLQVTEGRPPSSPSEFRSLPVAKILDHLRRRPGSRLSDLLAERLAAPKRVELAVAWLRQRGGLETAAVDSTPAEAAAAAERSASGSLDAALREVVHSARVRGFRGAPLHYLVLAEEGHWVRLRMLLENLPARWRPEVVRDLLRQLRLCGAASALLETEEGSLGLHFRRLPGSGDPAVGAAASICAGVAVWLDRLEAEAPVREILRCHQSSSESGLGALISGRPEIRPRAESLLAGNSRWRLIKVAPGSFENLLSTLAFRGI